MEINSSLDEIIKKWIDNIEEVTYFWYSLEPSWYPDSTGYIPPPTDLDIHIRDNKGNLLKAVIPLDKLRSPYLRFCNKEEDLIIEYEGDISICDSILKLIKKHKLIELE